MLAQVHPDGRLTLGGLVFRAAVGRGGVRRDKREGDGATPAGFLPLRRLLYRADRVKAPTLFINGQHYENRIEGPLLEQAVRAALEATGAT